MGLDRGVRPGARRSDRDVARTYHRPEAAGGLPRGTGWIRGFSCRCGEGGMMKGMTRRELFGAALAGAGLPVLLRAQQQQGTPPPADQLFDTLSLERRPAIVEESANDATVKAAELRLACPCPCTLDVFTCRTTDFTCSYSPERHKEIVALVEQGMGEEQVIDAMVGK